MCGRFTSSQRRGAIGERFQVAVPEGYRERYNLAPQKRALIIRDDGIKKEIAELYRDAGLGVLKSLSDGPAADQGPLSASKVLHSSSCSSLMC